MGPFPLGGGGQKNLPEFRILARTSNIFGQCIFALGGGGVFGGGEYCSFEVIGNRKPRRGGGGLWKGVFPSDGRDFFGFWGTKPDFWCVIRFKLTSTLAPNVYNDCNIRGEGVFVVK